MKYNKAQQTERIANGLGTIALGMDVLILIALAKFVPIVGPILALGWFVLICISAKAHYNHVKTLADPPTEKELFTASGEVRRNDDDLMAADLTSEGMRANMDTMT